MPDILVLILPVWAPPRECGPLGVSLAIPVTTLALFVGFCFGSIAPVWIPSVDNLGFPVGALWVELPVNKTRPNYYIIRGAHREWVPDTPRRNLQLSSCIGKILVQGELL